MLYAVAHDRAPLLPGYRRAVAQPIEPDLHVPPWSEIHALNHALALAGERRFRGVRYSLQRVRGIPRLSPRELLTLTLHPAECVPLALLHATRRLDYSSTDIEYDRRRFVATAVAERGRWLEELGARWNPYYDALLALDLTVYAATPLHAAIDSLAPWVDSVTDPRMLEPALRFRCAPLLELVASRIRCADRAFAEAVIKYAPVAAPALVLNLHVDDELRTAIGTLAALRLQTLRTPDELVPGVAEWVTPFLSARRNLLVTLSAVRERNCEPSPHVMRELVQNAELDRIRSTARTSARCRTARLALLALAFPMPSNVAERTYPHFAACLRAETVRWPDWQPAPPVGRRFRTIAEAVRDAEFPIKGPYTLYAPQHVACPVGSAILQRRGLAAATTMVRALSAPDFRRCLLRLSRAGLRMARRLCELATRDQLMSTTHATWRRLAPAWETRDAWHVLSLLPSARRDPAVRRCLIGSADPYIAMQILADLTPDEQREIFQHLSQTYPADALKLLEQSVGGIQRALHPGDFAELLDHWMPEIRLQAMTLLRVIGARQEIADPQHVTPSQPSDQ